MRRGCGISEVGQVGTVRGNGKALNVAGREPSLLELKEDFDEMRVEMRAAFADVRVTLDLKFLTRELYDANRRADRLETATALAKAEEFDRWKTWAGRVLVGGLVSNIAGGIALFLLLGGGQG